jgi:hypothetical protein
MKIYACCNKFSQPKRIAAEPSKMPISNPWSNPITLALCAAFVTGIVAIYVAFINAREQRILEADRAEYARILQAIQGSPDQAAENLAFLIASGLIVNPKQILSVGEFLKLRKVGSGPSILSDPCTINYYGFGCPGYKSQEKWYGQGGK